MNESNGVGNGIEKEGKTVGDASLTVEESSRLERCTKELEDTGVHVFETDGPNKPAGEEGSDGPGPCPVGEPGDEGSEGRDEPGERDGGLQCSVIDHTHTGEEGVLVAVLGDHTFNEIPMISSEYLDEQKKLHAAPRGYGGKGDKWTDAVCMLMQRYDCKDVLDFGSGQGSLARAMKERGTRIAQYDPAIPKHAKMPTAADLVVCTDVLEHIEPACLDNVLLHLRWLVKKIGFFVIATRPASKTLSDGRNAHLIIEDADWWRAKLTAAGFTIEPDAPVSPLSKPSREVVVVVR